MVSVIIPLYNKEKEIAKAINSVLQQRFSNFELIIVNDGSTDNSLNIVNSFKDPRIKIFSKPNGGVSSARNYGIKKASYDLIAFLDGDDWWSSDFLSVLFDLTNKYPDAGLWAGQYVQVDKKNEFITLDRFPKIDEGHFNLYEHLYAVHSSSVLIKKKVFEECGHFDETLTHGEDTDMWIRIAMKFKICYTNKIISYYNIGSNPLTKSTGKIPFLHQHFLSKIDNYLGQGGPEWDSLLLKRKISYLKTFYIQFPFDLRIKKMIKSLPNNEMDKDENKILKKPMYFIFMKHIVLVIHQNFVRLKNRINIKIK